MRERDRRSPRSALRNAALFVIALSAAGCGSSAPRPVATEGDVEVIEANHDWREFDRLWNYGDPAATEEKFRALLPEAEASKDFDAHAQLLSQISRTHGLRGDFDRAHAELDSAEALIRDREVTIAPIRIALERGRAFNSSGDPARAIAFFERAYALSEAADEEFHQIDAAHMLGIACDPEAALAWNERGIGLAKGAKDPRARRWLGPLLNNTAWTRHERGEFDRALELFEMDVEYRKSIGAEPQARIARWSVARTLRSMGRIEEALAAQRALLPEYEAADQPSGYVHEEIGECLWALDRKDEAHPHFARAFEVLSQDSWLAEHEADRLASLKERGEVD